MKYLLYECPWVHMRQYSHFNMYPPKEVTKQELNEYLAANKKYHVGTYDKEYELYRDGDKQWIVKYEVVTP